MSSFAFKAASLKLCIIYLFTQGIHNLICSVFYMWEQGEKWWLRVRKVHDFPERAVRFPYWLLFVIEGWLIFYKWFIKKGSAGWSSLFPVCLCMAICCDSEQNSKTWLERVLMEMNWSQRTKKLRSVSQEVNLFSILAATTGSLCFKLFVSSVLKLLKFSESQWYAC